jgi:hypothetical protein
VGEAASVGRICLIKRIMKLERAVVLEPDQSASREMLLIEVACRVPQANHCTM